MKYIIILNIPDISNKSDIVEKIADQMIVALVGNKSLKSELIVGLSYLITLVWWKTKESACYYLQISKGTNIEVADSKSVEDKLTLTITEMD